MFVRTIYYWVALNTMNTNIAGYCEIDLYPNGRDYKNVRRSLLKDLCSYVIIGHDFQKHHQHLKLNLGEAKAWSSDLLSL